jgi:hypothetical protein
VGTEGRLDGSEAGGYLSDKTCISLAETPSVLVTSPVEELGGWTTGDPASFVPQVECLRRCDFPLGGCRCRSRGNNGRRGSGRGLVPIRRVDDRVVGAKARSGAIGACGMEGVGFEDGARVRAVAWDLGGAWWSALRGGLCGCGLLGRSASNPGLEGDEKGDSAATQEGRSDHDKGRDLRAAGSNACRAGQRGVGKKRWEEE